MAEIGGFYGVDDCDAGLMCWNVDAETLEGTCAQYCAMEEDCDDPSETCSISNDGILPLCLPVCDPLAQDCEDGFGCYPSAGDEFVCIREGDPVHVDGLYHPSCPPGSFAATLEQMPSCVEGELCCASFCDQNDDVPCGETASCEPLPSSGVGYCRTL